MFLIDWSYLYLVVYICYKSYYLRLILRLILVKWE